MVWDKQQAVISEMSGQKIYQIPKHLKSSIFLNYYGNENISDKKPTFSYLRRPQLLLFIAEVFGVPDSALDKAYNIIQNYEQKGKIINTPKNGNYLWGKEVFREFKNALKTGEVNKIIRDNDNIGDIKKEAEKLFK